MRIYPNIKVTLLVACICSVVCKAEDGPVAGTALAGGKYITQYTDGGLSGNYSSNDRNNYPNSFVGYHPMLKHGITGKGVVFVAMGKGGDGAVVQLYNAAKLSGATPYSAGLAIINMVMLDSGDTSCALAHKNPVGQFKKVYEGDKHRGFPYYTNTF